MNYCTPVCSGYREETGAELVYDYLFWVTMLIVSKEEDAEISTIAHPSYTRSSTRFKTASKLVVIGAPFDTAVSFSSGARFDFRAPCVGSFATFTRRNFDPTYGVIPITFFYKALALSQMSEVRSETGDSVVTFKRRTDSTT
jgi:hypothetical protein